jgi:hypothetical protein
MGTGCLRIRAASRQRCVSRVQQFSGQPNRKMDEGLEFITSNSFEHSVVGLLKFVEADAIAERINDIHRPRSIEFVLNTGTQIAITLR